jgi:hypothetical protein
MVMKIQVKVFLVVMLYSVVVGHNISEGLAVSIVRVNCMAMGKKEPID